MIEETLSKKKEGQGNRTIMSNYIGSHNQCRRISYRSNGPQ